MGFSFSKKREIKRLEQMRQAQEKRKEWSLPPHPKELMASQFYNKGLEEMQKLANSSSPSKTAPVDITYSVGTTTNYPLSTVSEILKTQYADVAKQFLNQPVFVNAQLYPPVRKRPPVVLGGPNSIFVFVEHQGVEWEMPADKVDMFEVFAKNWTGELGPEFWLEFQRFCVDPTTYTNPWGLVYPAGAGAEATTADPMDALVDEINAVLEQMGEAT